MKRFFIFASAAIVALASCAKMEVVRNDAPEEIAFKQITNVMTKTITDGLAAGNMSVFAYWDGAEYFGNSQFVKDGSSTTYKGSPAKYWPVSGDVDFLLYAPYDNSVSRTDANTLTGISKNTNDQTDLLYGHVTASKTNDAVDVTLYHALAKVLIQVSGTSSVSLLNVELMNTTQKATAVINAVTPSVSWTADLTAPKLTTVSLYSPSNPTIGDELSNTPKECDPFLVVPLNANAASIKLTYKMGSSAAVSHVIQLSSAEWNAGKQYTYSISITPVEIKFTPSAGEWGSGGSITL